MKAEINNKNKANFFALYWGQEIQSHGIELFHITGILIKHSWLQLKPLSKISDDDAEECGYDNAKYFLSDNYLFNSVKIFDYLRSKGYALSYLGLSVEEMVEAGWIKLTE